MTKITSLQNNDSFKLLFKRQESPQYEVRLTLIKLLAERGLFTLYEIAKELDVDRLTVTRFFQKELDVEFMTLVKIVGWIEKDKE